MKQYEFNERFHQWERVDREQEYRGIKIETLTCHDDHYDYSQRRRWREYRLTWPDGHTSDFRINKRGGNITEIKKWLDFKAKYGEL